ncbi:MAG: hypothetical protein GC178_18095 [Flavobacteriales bacterium]|nr:hypothetical protein [Flavobacteriales bacterium]
MSEDNQFLSIIEETYRFKELMHRNRLILMYTDVITSETLENLVSITEDRLSSRNTETRVKKKIFNIMMECVQNITRHGQKHNLGLLSSIFILGKDAEERFFIVSGNNVKRHEKKQLQNRLDRLNEMNSDELHQHYLEVIDDGEISAKGGAGLGFIDIMRKSKSKIQYHFREVEDDDLFFVYKVSIQG